MDFLTQFAATEPGGLGALGLNVQSFLFQLITFVLVLLLLRKFVYGRLVDTLEARRQAVETSLDQAKQTALELETARHKVHDLIKEARVEADDIVATSHKEAAAVIDAAHEKAAKQTAALIADAHTQLQGEVQKARTALKRDTVELVALATERIVGEKVDARKDAALIERALEGAKK